jgi:hypothetical protein
LSSAAAETLHEIEGLSVSVNWKLSLTGYDQSGRPFSRDPDRAMRLYISSKGNVFIFPAESNRWNNVPTVSAVNQAVDLHDDQMMAWSMIGGHLTNIIKEVQGHALFTITIDPAALTSSFDERIQPDPQTGTVVVNVNHQIFRLESPKVITSACTVKRGNIFAPRRNRKRSMRSGARLLAELLAVESKTLCTGGGRNRRRLRYSRGCGGRRLRFRGPGRTRARPWLWRFRARSRLEHILRQREISGRDNAARRQRQGAEERQCVSPHGHIHCPDFTSICEL